jgi:beta-glucosidase-like glycosyl hydrolase
MITQHDVNDMAKRCIFGFDEQMFQPETPAHHIASHAPLGYIFFRSAFDACTRLEDVQALLQRIKTEHASHSLLLGLDQEGGQVERLNACVFPGLASPYTLGQAVEQGHSALAHKHYTLMAEGLKSIGFTLNFFPTLDVHQTPQNPIIGNRSFSESPEVVKAVGEIVIRSHHAAGIQSVLKHYPGHGNGVVDSHHALPELVYSPEEEANFLSLATLEVAGALPWVMVAHGAYSAIQTTPHYPASCDATVIQRLRHSGFKGIIITDDLDMRGVLDAFEGNQLQACIAALNAGVDVLLFREAGKKEETLLHELARAVERGDIHPTQYQESLQRIRSLSQPPQATARNTRNTEALFTEAQALHHALAPFTLPDTLQVDPFRRIQLRLPSPELLPHYEMDDAHHVGFSAYLETAFGVPVASYYYEVGDVHPPQGEDDHETLIITLVWLPKVGQALLNTEPLNKAKKLILNIGSPMPSTEGQHLFNIAGWRPLQQKAVAQHLAQILKPYSI